MLERDEQLLAIRQEIVSSEENAAKRVAELEARMNELAVRGKMSCSLCMLTGDDQSERDEGQRELQVLRNKNRQLSTTATHYKSCVHASNTRFH